MNNQSQKALQKLGLSTDLLLEAFLGNSQTAREDLTRQEHTVFWSAFAPPNTEKAVEKSIQAFFKETLTALLDVLDVTKELRVPTQSLINTLNFMQFFMNIKIDANIQKLLKRYQDSKAKYSRICPQGDEVIRTLNKRLVDSDPAVDSLIVQCTTLHSMDDFVRLTDSMSFPTVTDDDNRTTGEMAFNYAHLRNWVGRAAERQRQLLDSLLLKMRTLPQQMKMSPKLSETALLASLHIVRQVLAAVPLSDPAYSQSLIPALEQFLLWPQPCGVAAHAVLRALRQEALAPGHAVRTRAAAERAMLTLRSPRVLDTSVDAQSQFDAVEESGQRCLPLFYFMDAGSPDAAHWAVSLQLERMSTLAAEAQQRLSPNFACSAADADALSDEQRTAMEAMPFAPLYAPRPRAAHEAQMRAHVAQLLCADGICPAGDRAAAQALRVQLRRLSIRCLAGVHARLVDAANASLAALEGGSSAAATVDAARAHRAAELTSIYQAVWNAQGGDLRNNGDEQKEADADAADAEDAAAAHVRALHVAVPVAFGVDSAAFTFASPEMVLQIGFCPLPHTPAYDDLVTLAEMHAATATESSPAELRIMIAGSNKVLHAVCVAYLALGTTRPELMPLLRFRFFVVPFSPLPLAGYVARHDSWYNRHMCIPFRQKFFVLPCARVSAEPSYQFDPALPLSKAGAFMRTTLEQYARESEFSLDCTIFQMCGHLNAPTSDEARAKAATLGSTPDQILPFLQRVEIGNPARGAGQAGSSALLPTFKIKYSTVDMAGRALSDVSDDAAAFQHIVLSHMPALGGDVCLPANPSVPFLELYGLLADSSKLKTKNRVVRAHVSHVEITSVDPAAPVVVVVDGSICGPYFTVNIAPYFHDAHSARPATIPISTFFPVKP